MGSVCDATHSNRIGKRYLRFVGFAVFAAVLSLLAFRFFSISSARAAAAIFSVSILYLAAVRARFESFASDWLGLHPGQYRSDTRAHTTGKRCRSRALISRTVFPTILS